jgi:hypothetical protein
VERPAEPTPVASPDSKRGQATDRHATGHWKRHCRCLDLKMHLAKNNIIPTGRAPGGDISGRKVPNLEMAPAPDGLPGHLINPGWDKISLELPNLDARRWMTMLRCGGHFDRLNDRRSPSLSRGIASRGGPLCFDSLSDRSAASPDARACRTVRRWSGGSTAQRQGLSCRRQCLRRR